MSLFNRITTWAAQQILTASALNGEFNNLVNGLNNLDGASTAWTNVKTGTLNVSGTSITINGVLSTNAAGYLLGTMVQKVSTSAVASQTITNTSFANASNWNTAITPKSSTHIIRITWSGMVAANNSTQQYFFQLYRGIGGTQIGNSNGLSSIATTAGSGANVVWPLTIVAYDAPATTSSTTYALYAKSSAGSVVVGDGANLTTCTMLLEEIAQ